MASPKIFFFGDVAKSNEKMQVWRPKKSRFGDDFLRVNVQNPVLLVRDLRRRKTRTFKVRDLRRRKTRTFKVRDL